MKLLDRDIKAIKLMAEGHSIKVVATRLNTELSSVASFLRHARKRNGARNTLHLCVMAMRQGYLGESAGLKSEPAQVRRYQSIGGDAK